MTKAVLDTNVLVAALKSRAGASFRVMELVVAGRLQPAVTTPLMLEYESVLTRPGLLPPTLSPSDISRFLDWFAHVASRHRVHFLWRPQLPDPNDDLVLETSLAANCPYLITFNIRDFHGAADLGVVALTPKQFLTHLQP